MKRSLRIMLVAVVMAAAAIAALGQASADRVEARGCKIYARADGKWVVTCPVIFTGAQTYPVATAHYGLFGPTTGSPAAPAFRAIVATDLPGTLGNTSIPTLTVTTALVLPTQTANTVLAGPTTGSAAAPAFRALVAADIPGTLGTTTIPTLTVDTALNVTGTLTNNGVTWTVGAGAPSGPCTGGSIYTRTGATGGMYYCKNTTWTLLADAP